MPVLTTATKRILYVHVPKTGGTWVNQLMRSYGTVTGESYDDRSSGLPCTPQHFHTGILRHIHATDARTLAHDFDFVFMTVRDPIKRLESEFRYRFPDERRGHWQIKLGITARFEAWALRQLGIYRRDPFVFDNHIRPQHEFHAFDATVYRYEDGLDRIREALDELTGLEGHAPDRAVNRSDSLVRADYRLSHQGRDRIEQFYGQDFVSFDYERQGPAR